MSMFTCIQPLDTPWLVCSLIVIQNRQRKPLIAQHGTRLRIPCLKHLYTYICTSMNRLKHFTNRGKARGISGNVCTSLHLVTEKHKHKMSVMTFRKDTKNTVWQNRKRFDIQTTSARMQHMSMFCNFLYCATTTSQLRISTASLRYMTCQYLLAYMYTLPNGQ